MSVIKLTFDGSLNTAKQDAYFNYYLTNKQNGIIKGLGGEVAASASNGTITFTDGFVSVYGRRIYLENGTSIKVSLDSTKYGYVILSINTSANTVEIATKEGSATAYPALTKTDLLSTDGLYELVICGYYKTSSSLSINTAGVEYVSTLEERLTSLSDDTQTKINAIQNGMKGAYIARSSVSGTKQTFSLSSYKSKSALIVSINICGSLVTTSLSLISGSSYGLSVPYYYLGTWYTLGISYSSSSGTLTLTVGDSSHSVKGIYINY